MQAFIQLLLRYFIRAQAVNDHRVLPKVRGFDLPGWRE